MIDIFAIGSPFNADAISWQVLESLQHQLDPATITCHYLDRPGVQLVEELRGKHCVILLDALLADKQHGHIDALDWRDLQAHEKYMSSHEFSVAHALELASRLHTLPPQVHLLGICTGANTTLTEQQFAQASQQLGHYIKQVKLA